LSSAPGEISISPRLQPRPAAAPDTGKGPKGPRHPGSRDRVGPCKIGPEDFGVCRTRVGVRIRIGIKPVADAPRAIGLRGPPRCTAGRGWRTRVTTVPNPTKPKRGPPCESRINTAVTPAPSGTFRPRGGEDDLPPGGGATRGVVPPRQVAVEGVHLKRSPSKIRAQRLISVGQAELPGHPAERRAAEDGADLRSQFLFARRAAISQLIRKESALTLDTGQPPDRPRGLRRPGGAPSPKSLTVGLRALLQGANSQARLRSSPQNWRRRGDSLRAHHSANIFQLGVAWARGRSNAVVQEKKNASRVTGAFSKRNW